MESFAELIHNHAVFNGLTAEEIAELALISRKVNYAKGTCIFSESQPTTDFYVLAKGKVNLHFSKEHLISVYPGEVFGDWAMLNETVRLATATAIDEMEAFAIDATRFKNPQHLNASIALKVVMDMAKTLIGRVQAQSQVASRLLIRQGESETVEFKSTLRKNLHTQKNDSAIELAVLKTIAGFLNAKGGVLFIGVDDAGQIVGMEPDQFANTDKMLLHLGHLVSQKLGPTAVECVSYFSVIIEDKMILRVECHPALEPIFLAEANDQYFYTRAGNQTRNLNIKEALLFIKNHF